MTGTDPLAPEPPARVPQESHAAEERGARWPVVVAVLVAIVLIAVGTGAGFVLSSGAPADAATTSPSPGSETPAATPEPAPTGAEVVMPADCVRMLSVVLEDERWELEYERLADVPGDEGLKNEEGRIVLATFAFDLLSHVMTLSERLTCATTDDAAVTTVTSWITTIDGPQSEDLARTFEASSDAYSCSDWRDGLLCDIVWPTDGGEISERHFVRDGLWIALIQSSAWNGDRFDDDYLGEVVDGVFGSEG